MWLPWQHPHLVQVLSVGYDSKSSHVIVTQFKQGASLRDLVYQEVREGEGSGWEGREERGRDPLYYSQQTDPTRDWAEKYCSTGPSSQDSGHAHPKAGSGLIRKPRALPVEAVATYGRQILEVGHVTCHAPYTCMCHSPYRLWCICMIRDFLPWGIFKLETYL